VIALAVALFSGAVLAQDKKPEDPEVAEIHKKLAEHVVSFEQKGTLLADAVETLLEPADVCFVVDPALAEQTVELKLDEVPLEKALAKLVESAGAQLEIWRGVVLITSKKKPLAEPPAPALSDAAKNGCAKKITHDFDAAPLSDVADFVKELGGFTIDVPQQLKDVKVTVKLKDRTVGQVLDLVCRLHGLRIDRAGNGQAFVKR
jgi:hypothetical protein